MGKEYYNNGQLEYEGGYYDGYRDGNGKEFDTQGMLVFEGIYSYGKQDQNLFNLFQINYQ